MKHFQCIKNVRIIAYNAVASAHLDLRQKFEGSVSSFESEILDRTLLKLAQESLEDHEEYIVFIDAQSPIPPYWLTRLLTTLAACESAILCSALSSQIYSLSPLAEGVQFEGSLLELDKLIYHLQPEPSWFETNEINYACFVIRRHLLPSLEELMELENALLIASDHLLVERETEHAILIAKNLPRLGDQRPLATHPLATIHYQLDEYDRNRTKLPRLWLGLDNKPIRLHICMDWGGGVEKWINNICESDKESHHLVLCSQGELYRHQHGEQFSLFFAGLNGIEIAHFDFSLPIAATVSSHVEYERMLTKLIEKYSVQSIIVSTLIGHSMDCLRTGLPTIRVFHDYFPQWPALLALLDDDSPDLEQAFEQSEKEPFGRIEHAQFKLWQQDLVACYSQENVSLIAPDQSVVNNLQKISADTIYQTIKVIPHGIHLFPPIEYIAKKAKFTILIPGRIQESKGMKLLDECLAELSHYRIVLLGVGNKHNYYRGYEHVELVVDYQAEDLPSLLQHYQPDVALLLSAASESFSYTLSEMLQAGIPVVVTPSGALKNRVVEGENGFVVEPNANRLVALLTNLENNPKTLADIRTYLVAHPQQDVAEMVNQYRLLWQSNSELKIIYQVSAPAQDESLSLAVPALKFKQNSKKQAQEIIRQTDELAQRAGQFRQQENLLEGLLSERTKWAENLQAHVEELSGAVVHYKGESEKFAAELAEMQNSSSWKLTKPLRAGRRLMGNLYYKLRFSLEQMKTYPQRIKRSINSRGMVGTIILIEGKLRQQMRSSKKEQVVVLQSDFSEITAKLSETPQISIIIPVYNEFLYTYNCLKSLAGHKTKYEFEIIVIDDCSTDETEEKIQVVSGIRYHRQAENGGFIESCNQGATLANGEYLLFLNNDTLVHDGWLDSLLAVFDDFPDAGLVGSKLIYPDGSLQEAGGIIFSDASGWNVGRGGEPAAAEYNFVREVDYCSGASIIIRQDLFEALGKFDTRYKPAYYEDTDLAFAVRSVGKRVYYQPASVITHFEGVTSGTDLSSGTKRYQVINQEKFKDKWQQALSEQANPTGNVERSRLHGEPKRVLIYDACVPTPDQDSGSLRMINFIQILQDLDYHVVFMAENMPFTEGYTTALQQMGVECLYRPHVNSPIDYLKEKGKYLDVVIVSRYYIAAPVMDVLRQYCPDAKVVFDTVDLHYLREQRLAEFEDSEKLAAVAEKTRSKELAVIEQADITLVVSSFEQEFLATEAPQARVDIVSNIHKIHGRRKEYHERKDIMFVGGYQHPPNVDAIVWFAKAVFPLIRETLDIQLHIIGSKATKEVEALQEIDGIVFHGFVEDIEPFVDDCRISVAPLRYGAGVKGKVNMSMSYGQPVVATGIAAEGMQLENGHDILTADSEADFAQAVINLYNDSELWQKISDNGLENVEQWFSFNAAKEAIKGVLEK